MGKYGKAAIKAASDLRKSRSMSPIEAWERSVTEIFPHQLESRKKGCPRGAFLGLCEAGLLQGVPPGQYTQSVDNKGYAIEAVRLLRMRPELADNKRELWRLIMQGKEKTENQQLDVVLSLWNEGEIDAVVV